MPEIGEIKSAREIGKRGKCKYIWHACIDCGKQRWVADYWSKKPSYTGCCPSCALRRRNEKSGHGPASPSWKGGRQEEKDGYISVWIASDDFFRPMADKRGYALEHRLVMAKYLNRCLLPWEIVHHKGTRYPSNSKENRGDNRIENLQLLSHRKYHIVDSQIKSYIRKLENRVKQLEVRVTLLEAENRLLKSLGIRIWEEESIRVTTK